MFDPFATHETEDEPGTVRPESIHDDVSDDTQPLSLDDVDVWDVDEPDVGLTGLA